MWIYLFVFITGILSLLFGKINHWYDYIIPFIMISIGFTIFFLETKFSLFSEWMHKK